jgi:hypothetical protein
MKQADNGGHPLYKPDAEITYKKGIAPTELTLK